MPTPSVKPKRLNVNANPHNAIHIAWAAAIIALWSLTGCGGPIASDNPLNELALLGEPDESEAIQDEIAATNDDAELEQRRSMVQRRRGERELRDPPARRDDAPPIGAQFPDELRTIDGVDNNLTNPEWGAAGVAFVRLAPAAYADGISEPVGADRPDARAISNAVAVQQGSTPNARGASDYLWQWGQFLDHDIDETPIADPAEVFDIVVPTGDLFFDPLGTGTITIPLDRSAFATGSRVREQVNEITAFIDASNVYGSEEERAHALRTLDGTGRLRTSAGDLLPFNDVGLENAPSDSPTFFLAGDIRANEQVGLTAMHTLFVREHNFWADQIAAENPNFNGDEIYEHARAIVAAEMQVITYREFLPVLLGPNALPPYRGYRADVNPGIANEFATAAYRLGHSMLSDEVLRIDETDASIAAGNLPLLQAFFNPQETIDNGIDSILRGLAAQRAQTVDNQVIDAIRNFLFGPPGAGGFDLASLNIQRGRDHGLASLNETRIAIGLAPHANFASISDDAAVTDNLASVYASVEDIDLWVGGLAETHVAGGMVGETFHAILVDQFTRLRDGDRFWYRVYLPRDLVDLVESQSLADIIRRNTAIGDELPDNVFIVP